MGNTLTNLVTLIQKGTTFYRNEFDDLSVAIDVAKSLALGAGIVEIITEDREWECENSTTVKIEVI